MSILFANNRVGEAPRALQVRKSGRNTYPVMQLHVKLPMVLLHLWEQTGSVSNSHSLISLQLQIIILTSNYRY